MFEYSVIIPAFNAEVTIGDAISSVLSQSLSARHIIVVDDGSHDRTYDIAASMHVDVRRQVNQGPGAACNHALLFVETPFVAYLDADDIWLPSKIEIQSEHLFLHPNLSGVFSNLRCFKHGESISDYGRVHEGWGRTTMLMRTHDVRKIGPIIDPPNKGRGDMIDWIARGRDLGHEFLILPEILALRRIIPSSVSYGRDERDIGYLNVVRRALERKRGNIGRSDDDN